MKTMTVSDLIEEVAIEAIATWICDQRRDAVGAAAHRDRFRTAKAMIEAFVTAVQTQGEAPIPTAPEAFYLRAYPPNPMNPPAPHQLPHPGRLAMAIYLSQTTFGQATNPGKWESYDLNRQDFWAYVAYQAMAAYDAAMPKGLA